MNEKRGAMPHPALGLVPLAIYAAHVRATFAEKKGANSLWICHVALLLLGFGLLLRKRWGVGIACIWHIIGLPGWCFDMLATGERSATSVLSHVGGLGISLLSVRRTGIGHADWARASVFFLGLQECCRHLGSPELNVNAAFDVRPEARRFFPNYPSYLAAGTLAMLAVTYGINRLLERWVGRNGRIPIVKRESA